MTRQTITNDFYQQVPKPWVNGGFGTGGDELLVVVSISYLGHIITKVDIAMDPTKVQATVSPNHVRHVRCWIFFSLVGYYHKFVEDYDTIYSGSSHGILEEGGFLWSYEATMAF